MPPQGVPDGEPDSCGCMPGTRLSECSGLDHYEENRDDVYTPEEVV